MFVKITGTVKIFVAEPVEFFIMYRVVLLNVFNRKRNTLKKCILT